MVCEFLSIRSKLIDTSFVCGDDDGGRGVDDADGISSSPEDDDDAENGTRESFWFLRACGSVCVCEDAWV